MSTSIGDLSVGVTLDLSGMEQGVRKARGQLKQLDKEYSKMGGKPGGFGSSGFGSGFGRTGRGRASPARMDSGGDGGGVVGRIGGKLAGDALGNLTGLGGRGGDMLAGAGVAGGVAAGVALMFKFQTAVADFAKESGKLDDSSVAVIRYGEALTGVGKGIKDTAMGFAVEAMGTLNRFGEWIGSGFDMGAVNSANAGERAAIQQERARDKLYAENDPKQVAAIRESIRQFQRDDRFNSASPKEQQSMLRDEIASLATQEKKARAEKKIGEAEALKLERLKKEAELRKNIESFTAKQRENAEAIERASLARQDEEEEAERKKAEQLRSELDDIFAATERALATDGLARASSLASSQRNPFESSGVSGFGSASAAGAQFVQEGNRLLAEQLRALKRQEELLEDILARN